MSFFLPDPATLLEEAVFAEPIAEYTSGGAHVTLRGSEIEDRALDFFAGGYYEMNGAEAYFEALGSHWAVDIWEEPGSPFVVNLYDHGREWLADSREADCEFTRTQADAAGFAGRAECQGLRWLDQAEMSLPPVPGQAAFDATITFHAER